MLGGEDHPLLAEREGGKRLIVLITTDRGLAGAAEHEHDPVRRPRDHRDTGRPGASSPSAARAATRCAAPASRSRPTSRASATGRPSPTSCRSPGSSPTTSSPATYGRVDIVYSQFVSTLTQRPTLDQLLPIAADRGHGGHPRQPVHLRARARRPCSSSSCRATSRRACSRPCSRARPARSRAGWSR